MSLLKGSNWSLNGMKLGQCTLKSYYSVDFDVCQMDMEELSF